VGKIFEETADVFWSDMIWILQVKLLVRTLKSS
jgi:hypothetical protein